MNKPLFVLINGRGGTGKSTTLHALLENPPKGWIFFDFDNGKFPPPKLGDSGKEWRHLQHNWWLEVAATQHKTNNLHVCVLGVGIFPWQIHELPNAPLLKPEQFVYGMITCAEATRVKRLEARDPVRGAEYSAEKFLPIFRKMQDLGVQEFSTENQTPQEVAKEIKTWLESLEARP